MEQYSRNALEMKLSCSVSLHSLDSVMNWAEGDWSPVEQHGGIAHGQEHSHPLVEVPGDL